MLITSLQNPKIKHIAKLKSRRQRDADQLILIEGYRAIKLADENGFVLSEIYFCPELYLGSNEQGLVKKVLAQGTVGYETSSDVFTKIAYRDRPEGLIAIAQQFDTSIESLAVGPNSLFLVAESVEKPGNLGTMLRSADAAGVDGVIVCDRVTDIFNPNVVRASIGTMFSVKIAQTTSQKFFEWAKTEKVKIVATTPDAKLLYTNSDLTGRIAIAVGAEQFGLSESWLSGSLERVRIPMNGQADSLNVSAAATLVLFEALRQRT